MMSCLSYEAIPSHCLLDSDPQTGRGAASVGGRQQSLLMGWWWQVVAVGSLSSNVNVSGALTHQNGQ